MEVIRGKSKCAICDRVIGERDDIVEATHFIPDQSDPLWRFSQEPLHLHCFQKWDRRGEFVSQYGDEMEKRVLESIERRRKQDELIDFEPDTLKKDLTDA